MNILIDPSGHARLADFGLLTFISDPSNPTASSAVVSAGTTRWMSPELLHPEEFGFEDSHPTRESDYYALGMVILEVLSGQAPFSRYKDFIVMRKVIDGEHPERPEGPWFTDDLWSTLKQCWSSKPKERPAINAVLDCLGRHSATRKSPLGVEGDVGADNDSDSVAGNYADRAALGDSDHLSVSPQGALAQQDQSLSSLSVDDIFPARFWGDFPARGSQAALSGTRAPRKFRFTTTD